MDDFYKDSELEKMNFFKEIDRYTYNKKEEFPPFCYSSNIKISFNSSLALNGKQSS